MAKAITQKEALAYRARVKRLEKFIEAKRYGWTRDWPEGTYIGSVVVDSTTLAIVATARKLRHAVVVDVDGNSLALWADPIPEPDSI